MKKSKLFTSIAALALVLSLGACETTSEEETTPSESEGTTETTDTSESTSTTPSEDPDGYVLVGDFTDSNWDSKVSEDSKYYIPLGTTEYKQTVTIAAEPDYGEYEPWDAGLRVVEWGDSWNLVVGSDDLAEGSAEGLYGDDSKNIKVSWGETYDITVTFGETNSILVTVHEDGGNDGDQEEAWKLNTEYLFGMDIDGTLYYSDSGAYSSTFFYEGTLTTTYQTAGIFTVSEGDGNGYYITTTYYGTTEYVSLDTYTDNNGNEGEYLQFVEEPALIYWDGTNECWTNKDGSYFLGSYLYQSRNEYYLYAQPIESIASYSVASLIEIPATPTTLVISGETEVAAGETIQLTVTANEGAFDAVIWESSDPETATVSQDGTVSGLKAGSVTITATSTRDANVKATYAVEVKAAETGVLLEYEITSEKLQAEFSLGTQQDISGKTSTYSGFSVEWTGGNGYGIKPWGSAPNSAGGKDTIRVYSGNSFTIKDGDAHVSKIVIQCSGTDLSTNGCVKLSVNSNATIGSVTSAGTNVDQVEITVNDGATSATITSSGTAYICSIVVYYTF